METNEIMDRETYLRLRLEAIQNQIVTFKGVETMTTSSYIWAYRNTNCDVVSVITTVKSTPNGQMKEIKITNKEQHRIKIGGGTGSRLLENPLQNGLTESKIVKQQKISMMLKSEKNSFMSKLKTSRFVRTTIEHRAATAIQAVFRGFNVRFNIRGLVQHRLMHKSIRSDSLAILKKQFGINISFSNHRIQCISLRNQSATKIQGLFRQYISRKCKSRRYRETINQTRRRAVIRIQSLFRSILSRSQVQILRTRRKLLRIQHAVVKIQSTLRKLLAVRKVKRRKFKLRWVAARVIQCWFRARFSRMMVAAIKTIIRNKKMFKGAVAIQCLVRRMIAKRRVHRIRFRRLFLLIFKSVQKIQSMIRRFLAKIHVNRTRCLYLENKRILTEKLEKETQQMAVQKEAEETRTLLESVNIFLQAQLGKTTEVSDIFEGLLNENHQQQDPDQENEEGNTILSIAAKYGHLDLVRKCFLWGFNVNHTNANGESPLLLAVKYHHPKVVNYILSPPRVPDETPNPMSLLSVSEDDEAVILNIAIANTPNKGTSILVALLNHGFQVNVKDPETGMTPLHKAAEVGSIDSFKLLLKYKSLTEGIDDQGHSILHKAAGCPGNKNLFKILVGLDDLPQMPNYTFFPTPSFLMTQLMKPDIDGKDCSLLAALAGRSDHLPMIEDLKLQSRSQKLVKNQSKVVVGSGGFIEEGEDSSPSTLAEAVGNADTTSDAGVLTEESAAISMNENDTSDEIAQLSRPPSASASTSASQSQGVGGIGGGIGGPSIEEIGWTPNDITHMISLAETNNLACFTRVLEAGYDLTWPQDETEMNVAMGAARGGSLSILDLLLSKNMDFTLKDAKGKTALHYAAGCKTENVLSYLLSHENATQSQINEMCLVIQDLENDDTPIHIMVKEDVTLSFDLLARNGINKALSLKNKQGLSPFLLSASMGRYTILENFVRLGANVHEIDPDGHHCLWHLFHPQPKPNLSNSTSSSATSSSVPTSSSSSLSRHPTSIRSSMDLNANTNQSDQLSSLPTITSSSSSSSTTSTSTRSRASFSFNNNMGSSSSSIVVNSLPPRYSPIASEYFYHKFSSILLKRERDEESTRFLSDSTLVQRVLSEGSTFTSRPCTTLEETYNYFSTLPLLSQHLQQQKQSQQQQQQPSTSSVSSSSSSNSSSSTTTTSSNSLISIPDYSYCLRLDCSQVAIVHYSYTLSAILPSVLTSEECWMTALSAVKLDDSNKFLLLMLENGAASLLNGEPCGPSLSQLLNNNNNNNNNLNYNLKSIDLLNEEFSGSIVSTPGSITGLNRTDSALLFASASSSSSKPSSSSSSTTTSSSQSQQTQPPNANEKQITQDYYQEIMKKLQSSYFNGYTLVGWIIRLGNIHLLKKILFKGHSASCIGDLYGNTLLHIASQYGTSQMIDLLIHHDENVKIEKENVFGFTPSMVAAKIGNFKTLYRLFKYSADIRRSLDGKYWAYGLALTKRKEKNEKNLQTGRVEEDDLRYFSSIQIGPQFLLSL